MPASQLGNNGLSTLLIMFLLLYIYFLLWRLQSYFPCNFWFISITFVSKRIMKRSYLSLRPHYFRLRNYAYDFDEITFWCPQQNFQVYDTWDIMPCSRTGGYRRLWADYCLYLQGRGNLHRCLWRICRFLPIYMKPYPGNP